MSGSFGLVVAPVRGLLGPRSRLIVIFSLVLVGLIGAFAYVVVDSQSQSRHQSEQRFSGEASISAELISSLLTTSTAAVEASAAKSFGGQAVDGRRLAALARSSKAAYMEVLDLHGHVIASTPGAPPRARPRSLPTHVRRALAGSATLSDIRLVRTVSLLEWALPFTTPFGRRVEIEAVPTQALSGFLNSYLSKAQSSPGASAFILDSQNRIVGVSSPSVKPGTRPKSTALLGALATRSQGGYHYNGSDRYFASAPVDGSTWHVVLVVRKSQLYSPLSGSKSWFLFAILGAFALAGVASLVFFRRAIIKGLEVAEINSELKQVNATLEERVAERTQAAEDRALELARSNEELEQFSSVASHDLQEPLRKIRMFGDRLRERLGDSLAEEPAADLERMRSAAERMQRLISDLLEFSRVSHRGEEFESVDLDEVVQEVVADLEARIVEVNGRIEIDGLPTVEADRTQMRQLMQNLIGNALKFHRDEVPPLVRIQGELIPANAPRFAGESTPGDRCALTIEDNGIGFDERHAERVFTAFERLHGRSAYEGTGIGLSIARKIVWRHGGHITATSVPGEGATFTVTLPLSQPAVNGKRPE